MTCARGPGPMPAKKPAKAKPAPKKPAPRIAPRADKGEGEAAVKARIAALDEPVRGIMKRLHPMIKKHGPRLKPTVKWGFAVYLREGKMVLVAAPRKKHVSFGYTMDVGKEQEPLRFEAADEVDDATVAKVVKRVAG